MCGSRGRTRQGWTLVEMMIAVAIFAIAGMAIASLFIFSSRSLVAMSNYGILDKNNRQAMDLLSREVRQARKVLGYTKSPPTLSILDGDGNTVVYSFSPTGRKMVRDSSDGTHQVLLENCEVLQFALYKRNPVNAKFELLPVATNNFAYTAKVLVMTWRTSMALPGTHRTTSEHVNTARVVIRKAHTSD